jgi:hypothetical protein
MAVTFKIRPIYLQEERFLGAVYTRLPGYLATRMYREINPHEIK